MTIETRTVDSPVYEIFVNDDGIEELGKLIRIESSIITELFADEGNHFVRRADGVVLGDRITLGENDSPINYTEV